MKKLILLLLLISVSTYGQLSPGLSSNYFETSITAGSNKGVTSDALNTALDLKADLASPSFTGTPTAPTAAAGTNTTQIATTAFVLANARPYKVYVALLSQTGTSAPTVTVLENTLSGTVVWTRSSSGVYLGTLSGAFTANKTVAFAQLGAEVTGIDYAGGWDITVRRNSTSVMQIRLHSSGTASDELNTSIEIRVYP